ncbi:hypothetical protein [Gimesia algae]|uniref:Secretin/TonB short N-terminal domain-containing protein n=1 Tax=Gimesia algae TaxID=2527971 RepID=A0A517V705_9PLAN|nr:hypothetical protein [Gimesia algae]QDT88774.1 hypothetical protein Pan161_03930 [Gimesia algae]
MRHYLPLTFLMLTLAAAFSLVDAADSSNAKPPAHASPLELKTWKALQQPISLTMEEMPLSEVLREISRRSDINLFLDSLGLQEVGLTPKTPVTIEVKGIKSKSVLNLLLEPLDLAYVMRDEVVVITSRTRSLGKPYVVSYPVADLAVPIPLAGPVPADETASAAKTPAIDFESLIDLIQSTVDPDSWETVGGNGSIQPHAASQSLVIRQTSKTHQRIEDLFTELRRQQDFQISLEMHFLENVPEDFWEQIGLDLDLDKQKTARPQPQNNGPLGGIILTDKEVALLLNEAQNNARTNLIQAPQVTLLNAQTAGVTNYTAGGKQHPLQHPCYIQPVISPDRREVRLKLRISNPESSAAAMWTCVNTVSDRQTILIEIAQQKTKIPVIVKTADTGELVYKYTSVEQTRSFLLIRPKIIVQEEEEKALFSGPQK